METRALQIRRNNLKEVFLDAMDYLNKEAKRIGCFNCKDLIYKWMKKYNLSKDYAINTALYMCDLRNNIGHGDAVLASTVTHESLWIVYLVGIVALGHLSKIVEIRHDGKDFYFYENGELKARALKLQEHYENGKLYLLLHFFS